MTMLICDSMNGEDLRDHKRCPLIVYHVVGAESFDLIPALVRMCEKRALLPICGEWQFRAELDLQIDDWNDHAARVQHAANEFRRTGNPRGLPVSANLLHAQDVDAVFLSPRHMVRYSRVWRVAPTTRVKWLDLEASVVAIASLSKLVGLAHLDFGDIRQPLHRQHPKTWVSVR